MTRTSIGLDVGTKAVRIAEVTYGGGKPNVTRFGRALLPAGAVQHGEVQDPAAVATAISGLWKRLGLKGRAVHVGVANKRVVLRVIELPMMAQEDLENAVRFQAQEHIPIPLDEAVMDYEVLEEIEGPDGQRLQRVLVVAAEQSTIQPLLEALSAANLDARTLELNAYPLVRCFDGNGNGNGNGDGATGAQAIVDIGAGITNVVIHSGGRIRFTRILPSFGGEEFTTTVAEGLDVSPEEAEKLKRQASEVLRDRARATQVTDDPDTYVDDHDAPEPHVVGDLQQTHFRPAAPAPISREDAVADLLESHVERFVTEVQGSLDFYTSQLHAPSLDKIILTGGGSLLGGLTERLEDALGVPVEHGHPFAHVPVNEDEVTPRQASVAEPFLGVAVGLALAENGG